VYEEEKARIEGLPSLAPPRARPRLCWSPGPPTSARRPRPLLAILVGLAVSLLVVVGIAGIIVTNVIKSNQATRETAAMVNVRAIDQGQVIYTVTKGKGRYTDLMTLADEGLIDAGFGYGERSGYLFTSVP